MSGRTIGIVESVLSCGAEIDGVKCDLMMPIEHAAHLQIEDKRRLRRQLRMWGIKVSRTVRHRAPCSPYSTATDFTFFD
jgi:hypothetical protein